MSDELYWHVRHNVLVERCWSYKARANYIREVKPLEEQTLRLRLFKPVRGPLPEPIVRSRVVYEKAWNAYYEASVVCDKAKVEHSKETESLHLEETCEEKRAVYVEARDTYDSVLEEHHAEMEALHREECPDCPWDGKTIFPTREEAAP